ncbi:MAG: hypothetical protein WEE64_04515 [Dehalococcoidia bacterium]
MSKHFLFRAFLVSIGVLALFALLGGAANAPAEAVGPTADCPDFNADQAVDTGDIALVVQHFGTGIRQDAWYPAYDLNIDGAASIADIALTVTRFGAACPGGAEEQPFEVIDQDHCQGIKAHAPTLRVARTADEFESLWTECGFGLVPLPSVDFATEMVVGVVVTRESKGYALRIEQIAVDASEASVRATFAWPGPACIALPVFNSTSQIVEVQRTDLPVSLAVKKAAAYCSVETIARGTASGIGTHPPEVRVARTQQEWQALWAEHAGDVDIAPPDVVIDFEREMVVGVFDEYPTTGHRLLVGAGWTVTGKAMVVRVIHNLPSSGCPGEERMTRPHHIVIMPRLDLPVEIAVLDFPGCPVD